MKNNTVVIGCDGNYFWGAFIFIASMRKNSMDEPVIVFQRGMSASMRSELSAFGSVKIIDAPDSKRNMTSRKAEAMLFSDTDYITWVDCDGYFTGNCSSLLIPSSENSIHIRMRDVDDNLRVFSRLGVYAPSEHLGAIPEKVLDVWRRDVDDLAKPRICTCGSACFLSVHKSMRYFLERWRVQMEKVLPQSNVGVTDSSQKAYFQLDESVLNSLLCFMHDAPEPCSFRLNCVPGAVFRHMIGAPKPWTCWTKYSIRYYKDVMEILEWAGENSYIKRSLPFSLRREWEFLPLTFIGDATRLFFRFRNRMRCGR